MPADLVGAANRIATGGLTPDLTLVLDLDPAIGRGRQVASGKQTDRLDDEAPDFHARVAAAYRAASGPGVRHLDAAVPADRLAETAWAELERSWRLT